MRHKPVAKPHGLRRLKVGEPVRCPAGDNQEHTAHHSTVHPHGTRHSVWVNSNDCAGLVLCTRSQVTQRGNDHRRPRVLCRIDRSSHWFQAQAAIDHALGACFHVRLHRKHESRLKRNYKTLPDKQLLTPVPQQQESSPGSITGSTIGSSSIDLQQVTRKRASSPRH